ncbi:hypothetical protein [Nocardia flavorosea]|uniref:Uncharacterized protein n=1 Tax=Nocardia flavorosea TaxID=53429 RepID=A0A846Y6C2_9NOCA|nr:hypothetical protein [Nocardia flavorosea]NKY54753.1 hypothetical protein [Nocardia flavorosea]
MTAYPGHGIGLSPRDGSELAGVVLDPVPEAGSELAEEFLGERGPAQ